jgi:hypothetical protein
LLKVPTDEGRNQVVARREVSVHRAIGDFTNTGNFGDADGTQALITRD